MRRIFIWLLLFCSFPLWGQSFTRTAAFRGAASVRPVSATQATATDTFDRSNANPISNPMSDGVGIWISGPGTFNDAQVSDNRWAATANTSGAMVGYPAFAADHEVQGVPVSVSGCGLCARMQGTNTSNCYFLFVASTTSLQFYRRTSDSAIAQLGTNVVVSTIISTDTLKLRVSGTDADTTLTAYVNGAIVGIQKDTNASGWYNSGQPGLYGNSSKLWNNFYATDL